MVVRDLLHDEAELLGVVGELLLGVLHDVVAEVEEGQLLLPRDGVQLLEPGLHDHLNN